jgi:prolyl 3-hydroxylase /prolyl 3,4-dihydroxylase
MKRKTEDSLSNGKSKKKTVSEPEDIEARFRSDLFDQAVVESYQTAYAKSQPYKHGVIHDLVDDQLLRSVRAEILEHLHFTPKETDIYKIHQSGDLANLDGLEDSALSRLPTLLKLRDALYSKLFRVFISQVADSGPLSGLKTDMAINVYTPGCHLLCHDDVIGTRRLSYILYLPDPDKPWKPEWGGALRLYPTEMMKDKDGTEALVPSADFTVSIPPSFNQLSFFTIQPGKSFHDVEEVYAGDPDQEEDDGGRVRMAISGWFHIPQPGESGHEPGLEEKLAERSSLAQLQSSKADRFDLPKPKWRPITEVGRPNDEDLPDWTEDELDWLLKFVNPKYLIPATVEELADRFRDDSAITLGEFLNYNFADELKGYISGLEADENNLDGRFPPPEGIDDTALVGTARPPHKHRFTYRHSFHHLSDSAGTNGEGKPAQKTPLDRVLDELLPSPLFARWLALFTGLIFKRNDLLARRFRRGKDYTLATSYEEEAPMLEIVLGLTPTSGWGGAHGDEDDSEDENEDEDEGFAESQVEDGTGEVGGYEVYMVGEEDEEEDDKENEGPSGSHTGAGNRRKSAKSDPAIYRTQEEEEDNDVIFANPASWNVLSVVLRDQGLLRFVKYVSRSAKGDRWDVMGNFEVEDDDE